MKCVYCGSTENLTKDHKIPKWLFLRAYHFGIKRHKLLKKELGATNTQILCRDCNGEKGGFIDYSLPEVRVFMKEIRDNINENLKTL